MYEVTMLATVLNFIWRTIRSHCFFLHYIELYYADDYSLAEIAEEFGVSRQAVYDNIKRTEKILEDYEMKLHMYSDYIVRSQIFDDIMEKYADDSYLQEQIAILSSIDNRD